MTLSQFSCKPISDRTQLVMIHGRLLTVRLDPSNCIFLFYMYSFFVELWYQKTDCSVVMVHGFNSTDLLEPYLVNIDLSKLV